MKMFYDEGPATVDNLEIGLQKLDVSFSIKLLSYSYSIQYNYLNVYLYIIILTNLRIMKKNSKI